MILSAREKILLFLLALVIVVTGGMKFLVNPALDRMASRRARLAQALAEGETASRNVQTAVRMSADVQSALAAADSAASALLPSTASDKLNVWFLSMARQNGLTLTGIRFGDPVATDIRSAGSGSRPAGAASSQTQEDDIAYQLRTDAEEFRGTASAPSAVSGPASSAASSVSSVSSTSSAASSAARAQLLEKDVTLSLSGPESGFLGLLDAIKKSGRTVRVVSYSTTVQNGSGTATVVVQCFGAEKPDDSDSLFR